MEEFLSFIADILEVDKNTLTLETSQDDVETWDSLMQLRLLGEIEAKYGVMIPMGMESGSRMHLKRTSVWRRLRRNVCFYCWMEMPC